MAKEIILPDLGMDMEEALLITWTKQPGDTINVGDVIAEVETDKTTVEVQATVGGTILEWKFKPGDQLKIGGVIGSVGEAGESAPVAVAASAKPAAAAAATTPVVQAAPVAVATNGGTASPATTDSGRIMISPIARKIADERGIDPALVRGTGPGGRIVREDVEKFTPSAAPVVAAPAPSTPEAPKAAPAGVPSNVGYLGGHTYGKLPEGDGVTIEDVSKLRARIADRMATAQQQIPHFYVTMEVQMDALVALRKQLNASIPDEAKKISVNDMIVKAVALAARDFPQVQTHYYGDKFVIHKHVNVGIAVALDNGGLMNVVAQDADRVSLGLLAQENRARIGRAREGKVAPADIQGETITVSNLGMYGVDVFSA
ncbi:MAG: dihydrolipoamide acetyltransferase family protein, partial [Phototrophicaceae bacterium]